MIYIMNKYMMLLAFFFTINGFFYLTGFLFPTVPIDKTMPIQIWVNALLLFYLFLQNNVATFIYTI
jgi:hypothetical protein